MGGWGSGRYEYASTPTVEECRHLDTDRLKHLAENPGIEIPLRWGDREDPEATIGVRAEGERDLGDETRAEALRLKYTLTDPRTGESQSVEYTVALEYTECHFGGFRPWFRCPECNTRRRKLYLPVKATPLIDDRDRYLCRECYDLGYTTSRTSGDDLKQAALRYRRAFARADAENRRPHPNNAPHRPERPKGMHHDTFEDLLEDVDRALEEWSREMESIEEEILDNLKRVV